VVPPPVAAPHRGGDQTGDRVVASTPDQQQPVNAGEALERLGRTSLGELSVGDLLQALADAS
jgi:hypothetical protein